MAKIVFCELTPKSGEQGGEGASFSVREAKSVREYVVSGSGAVIPGTSGMQQVTIGDLQLIQVQVLGNTLTNPNARAIIYRTSGEPNAAGFVGSIPANDPVWRNMFADSCNGIKGTGGASQQVPALLPNGIRPTISALSNWSQYQLYRCRVQFTPRPYIIAPDQALPATLANPTWYDETGTLVTTSVFAYEWLRYTYWDPTSQSNFVTAKRAGMIFNSVAGPSSNNPFMGNDLRIRLPDYLIKFHWIGVPYRYLLSQNSYINRYIGYVNQNDFDGWSMNAIAAGAQLPTLPWKAGDLLYLGYAATPYTQPAQSIVPVTWNGGVASQLVSPERLCDIEFAFLGTKRRRAADPTTAPTNLNFVAAGHNLLPWLKTRFFYYATVGPPPSTATSPPSWFSIPFELFFTDPDAPGAYQIT